jgi:hypothetical protein
MKRQKVAENCMLRTYNFFSSSPNVIRMIKLRRMRWTGHVARKEERNRYTIFVGKQEIKRQLGRQKYRCVVWWYGLHCSGPG